MKIRKSAAFTLIELLAVIAIISFLIALVIPALQHALEKARQVKCKSNLRNIGIAIMSFADDHNGRLPGVYKWPSNPEEWQKPIYGKEALTPEGEWQWWMPDSDHVGTLVEYLPVGEANAHKIYRCPSHKMVGIRSGKGSNGMFDYTMLHSLGGVQLSRVPQQIAINPGGSGDAEFHPTPLVTEEGPERLNKNDINPGFSNLDTFGHWHDGDIGFYCAVDGSVNKMELKEDGTPAVANDCMVKVLGDWESLGWPAPYYGKEFGLLPWD